MAVDLLTNAKRIYQGQPSTTESTLATVGTGKKWIVLEIAVTNVTGNATTLDLSIVPSGGAAGVANRLYKGISVDPNSTLVIPHYIVMDDGDFISGLQGTNGALTVIISGCEVAV